MRELAIIAEGRMVIEMAGCSTIEKRCHRGADYRCDRQVVLPAL